MDKSMIPILVAMVAIVAAGAALALHGGGTEDNGEPPSGYPPGLDGPEKEKIDPIDPNNKPIVSLYFRTPSESMEIGESRTFTVMVSPVTEENVNSIVWASTNDEVCHFKTASLYSGYFAAVGVGECFVTASLEGVTAICHVTVVESESPAGVPSVSGGSTAMEFNLELALGGSKAIDVPSEYLSLLSMAQWSSSDPSVCTVAADSEAGTVVAVAHRAGECDLTASLGFYSAVCHVTVGRSQ